MTVLAATPSDFSPTFQELRESIDWAPVRRRPRLEDVYLLPSTKDWVDSLDRGLRPLELPLKYPRIANEVSRYWRDIDSLEFYLDSLLISRRGGRQGFPPIIHEELSALAADVAFRRARQAHTRQVLF